MYLQIACFGGDIIVEWTPNQQQGDIGAPELEMDGEMSLEIDEDSNERMDCD
jgi:hypothetical protein